jgi:hypothetical protein
MAGQMRQAARKGHIRGSDVKAGKRLASPSPSSFSLPVFGEGRVGSFLNKRRARVPHPARKARATLPEAGEG